MLQGDTRCNKGLKKVTGGYKGLQSVKRDFRGLQKVT